MVGTTLGNAFGVAARGTENKRTIRKGAPGFQKSPGVDFFFKLSRTPPPLLGQKRICHIYSEKNIYGFRIYYKNIVYSSMPCVVSLLSTPVKPYVHALCLQRSPGG